MRLRETVRRIIKTNSYLLKVSYYLGIYFILDTLINKNGVYILCYHRLSDHEPGSSKNPMTVDYRNFVKQLEYLKGKYEIISMDQAVELLSQKEKLKKRYIVITFDDGYRDNYVYGREIFHRFGVKPTIYLAAAMIDQRSWLWHDSVDYLVFTSSREDVRIDIGGIKGLFPLRTDTDKRSLAEMLKESIKQADEGSKGRILHYLSETLGIRQPEECGILLDWGYIKSLMETGADMGGHTMFHPILSHLDDDEMRYEVAACKKLIEEHTQREVHSFAYPNGKPGDFTRETKIELKKHYKSAVTTVIGVNLPGMDLYELHRILIGNDPDLMKFRFKLLQAKISNTMDNRRRPLLTSEIRLPLHLRE